MIKEYIKKTKIFYIYKNTKTRYLIYKSSIFNSRFIYQIAYNFYFLKNTIENLLYYNHLDNQIKPIDFKKIKSVIVVYSKMHFDPEKDIPENPLYFTGTASVSRQIWKLFDSRDRFFVDIKARRLNFIPKADLIIGLMSENFRICAKHNPQAKKILLLVNCHPLYRSKVLLNESLDLQKKLPSTEWVSPDLFFKVRKYADSIALTGNNIIKDTYLEFGVREIPIHCLNTAINTDRIYPKPDLRPKDKIRFIYPASHKAIRKGLFRVLNSWKILNTIVDMNNIELYLIGGDEPSFIEDIKNFAKQYTNVYNIPWVDNETQLKYFQSSHVVIAPAIEEGQVTTVLEVMACGAVPIITPECGINLEDGVEGFIIKDYRNANEIADYMKELVHNRLLREKMSDLAISNVLKNNNWKDFKKNLVQIIEN